MKRTTILATTALAVFVLLAGLCSTATAQNVSFETESEWKLDVTGMVPVFLNFSNHEEFSSNGDDQFATRIMSGFNPANITFNVAAPAYNGIVVGGQFQINTHLQGPSVQNDGLFESRIADIYITGNFGTVNMGKGFGIFNSIAIGDAGSGMGVGRFGGPDASSATLGRIGSGYVYANFNPRITYTTPDMDGFTLKVGLINPEKPGGPSAEVETALPRMEAQLDYMIPFDAGSAQIWAGAMYQNVNVVSADFDYDILGFDTGLKLNFGGLGLTGAFTYTEGVGADGLIGLDLLSGNGLNQAEVEATQWYGEATYNFGRFLLGASYGEGSQDAQSTAVGSAPDITNELLMAFFRYSLTPNLTLLGEFQTFSSEAQDDYVAGILGLQLNF